MNELSLRIGKINEQTLVEKFGTQKQKDNYSIKSVLDRKTKQRILEKANRYGKVKDLGEGQYYIGSIYEFPVPTNFQRMNTSLYQYLVPLILMNLLQQETRLNLTTGRWAREFHMVNQNYSIIRNHKKAAEKIVGHSEEDLYDFYNRADASIDNYVGNAFKYLQSTGYIIYQEVFVVVRKSVIDAKFNSDGEVDVDILNESKIATEEELKFYAHCMKIADEALNIENEGERYYSSKASKWNKIVTERLLEKDIFMMYKTHQAYIVHKDRCRALLKQFEIQNETQLIKELTNEFISGIITNAEKRFLESNGFYNGHGSLDSYINLFNDMTSITINPKANRINLNNNDVKVNYKEVILNNEIRNENS